MTILVTGGTGRVGSRPLPHLVDEGVECRSLVRAGKGLLVDGSLARRLGFQPTVPRVYQAIREGAR